VVHHAAGTKALAAAVAALALCPVLSGCLGGDSSNGPAAQGGATIGGSVRLADCAGWREAGPQQRRDTVEDIREFAGGLVGTGSREGATLPNDKAYDLFEGACRPAFAKRFKLYKLYTRAAAFQDLEPR
jgi:hypothetical protein